MADTNSPELKFGVKIGHLFMTYIVISIMSSGGKLAFKSGRGALFSLLVPVQ